MTSKQKFFETIYEIASVIVTSIITVCVIFMFLFKISVVSGESMENTLHNGDNLLISSITTEVKPGDVVVVSQPNGYEKVLIKRVIAVEGQTVSFDMETGKTLINGIMIDEPYVKEDIKYTYSMTKAYTVPAGKLFVMGDNRNNSADSRDIAVGMIDEDYILGKVIYKMGDNHLFEKETVNG